jgi:riboflavin kinase/FMN adenylyltransferase
LDDLGTDIIVIHPFTHEISQSSAKEFVERLIKHLDFRQLWAGQDFALGRAREGNVSYLIALGQELNYQVHIADPVLDGGRIISSSHIRHLITEGSIDNANKLLGRPYRISGEVVHGDGRGKLIGIPTANLDTRAEKLVPGAGVYACKVNINNQVWASAVNIGTRPTFESKDHASHVEAHILDYSDDLWAGNLTRIYCQTSRGNTLS